jgi:hypothetical protein
MRVMASPTLLLFGLLATADPPLPAPPQPRPLQMSLDQIREMDGAVFVSRAEALIDGGYRLIDRFGISNILGLIYRSPARASGLGMCEATELVFDWEAPLLQLPPDHFDNRWLPVDRAAPLQFHSGEARRVFHWLDDRPRSSRRTEQVCDRVDSAKQFVRADSADHFRYAARWLRRLKQQLANNPAALEIDCRGWPDCLDRIRLTSINDLYSVTPCHEWGGTTAPGCLRFNLPDQRGSSGFATQGFEIDIEGAGRAARIARLRWRAMAHFD